MRKNKFQLDSGSGSRSSNIPPPFLRPVMQSMPSGFVAAGSARPVSRPSQHCVCFRILAVAVPPAAAHMVRPSLKVHAVPLAALGRVETRQSPAAPALGCINIGLLHVTLASSVSSR